MSTRRQAVVLLVPATLLAAVVLIDLARHPDRLPTVLAGCGATVLTVLLLRRP